MGDRSSSVSNPPGTLDDCRATVGLEGVAMKRSWCHRLRDKPKSYVGSASLHGDGKQQSGWSVLGDISVC